MLDIYSDAWEDAKHRQVYILYIDLHLAVCTLVAWEDDKHLQVYILLRRRRLHWCADNYVLIFWKRNVSVSLKVRCADQTREDALITTSLLLKHPYPCIHCYFGAGMILERELSLYSTAIARERRVDVENSPCLFHSVIYILLYELYRGSIDGEHPILELKYTRRRL